MVGDRFSSSTSCSGWLHETAPARPDPSLSCLFLKVATHPFRLISERAVVVDSKVYPFGDAGLAEWYERMLFAYAGRLDSAPPPNFTWLDRRRRGVHGVGDRLDRDYASIADDHLVRNPAALRSHPCAAVVANRDRNAGALRRPSVQDRSHRGAVGRFILDARRAACPSSPGQRSAHGRKESGRKTPGHGVRLNAAAQG